MEESPKRIALIVSARSGNELRAGHSDVSNFYSFLTNPELGGCTNTNPPIHGCESRNDFVDCLTEVLQEWDLNNQFIFYFSGHGEIRSEKYCLKFGKTYFSFGSLIEEIQTNSVKRAILIIDACHSGAALEGVKNDNTTSQLIDTKSIPEGIAVIASSRKSQTSQELKDGSLSVFTKLFCEGVQNGLDGQATNNGYISIGDIINYIKNKLKSDLNYSEFHQRPIYCVDKADGEIWIAKNKSGKISKQIQPQITEAVTSSEELKMLYEKTLPNLHPCVNASIQDLDWDLIKSFVEGMKLEIDENISHHEMLSKLKLYSPIKLGGKYYLHKSAVLCFYKRPDTIFHQARSIFCVENLSDSKFISENIYGSLRDQVEKLVERTREYLQKISFVDKKGIRQEEEEIDIKVIRELISNAIAHRDYSLTGTVKVSITPDRIEVQNPGRFPSGASWGELISNSARISVPLDAAVSQYLRMLRVFEGSGLGFIAFREYRKKNGSESITCIESNTPTVTISIQRTKLKQLTTGKDSIDPLLPRSTIDSILPWSMRQTNNIFAYPILEDLAKVSGEDFIKDFFKDCLKKVIHFPKPDLLKEAYRMALKEFLVLFGEELEDAGYEEATIKQYIPYLQKLVKRKEVSAALGMAFNVECKEIDTALLGRVWAELNSPLLPEDMKWDFLSKSYIRAVKKIVQSSDKLRPIFDVQILETAATAQEVARIAPAFGLKNYAEGLREQYGNLKLESLDTTGVYYNELKLWKIFIPQNLRECQEFIPQVYELPKDRSRLLQESGQLDVLELAEAELENHRKRYVEQPIRGVFEVLGDPQELAKEVVAKYAVILGDPGSGKSTLLQYLALIWAERPVRDLPLYPLPLLLELRTYVRDKQAEKCKDIVSFIHRGNITCRLNQQDLHEKLKNGNVIALFDGFDEVFEPALRDDVMTDIYRFINEYPVIRVIVTSRWLGYKAQRLRDAGFQHFMLQELNDEQMQDFMVRWHDLNFAEGADKDRKRERLQKAIRESRSIKDLAGNPLLLTMMAILNRNQELPMDRPELYNQASRVLLHQWDVERALVEDRRIDPKIIDYRDKQAMLRKVAHYMQSSAKGLAGNLISAAQLESILTDYLKTIEVEKPREIARIMIGQLRTRNFILCDLGGDSYGFVHRTFLEYFCAWEFVWQFKEEQTLTIEQLIHDVFGKHWQDESWHEVLRLISGMIEPRFVADIIDFLLEQKVDKSEFLDERDRLKKEGLSNLLLAVDCFVEVRNRNLIAVTSSKLLKILQHEAEGKTSYKVNYELANRIINNIASIWQDSSEILDWLKDHALNDENEYVRRAAVQEIAKGWKDDPQTFDFVRDRAIHDPFKREKDRQTNPRQTALEAILEHYSDNPQTLELLKTVSNNDPDEKLKEFAKKKLVKLSENPVGA